MFELFRRSSPRELYTRHLPGLGVAFLIAELFYKWGSFALECLGFLATWFVLDLVYGLLSGKLGKAGQPTQSDNP
tara:strand:- start:674 stop:898 length:225 start_codon:yes stop_codon:yes gene_type:complete